jgi:hypothetical protein
MDIVNESRETVIITEIGKKKPAGREPGGFFYCEG